MKPDKFLIIAIGALLLILIIIIILGGAAILCLLTLKAGPITGGGALLQKTYDYNGTLSGFDQVNLQVNDLNGNIIVKKGDSDNFDISVNTQGTKSDYSYYNVSFSQSGASGSKTLGLKITNNGIITPPFNSQYHSDIIVTIPDDKTYDMDLGNANGRIEAGQFNCNMLTMNTANGGLISMANATTASYNTANGLINITTSALSGSINASTFNGEIDVTVPSAAGVSINAHLVNGEISTNLPLDVTDKGILSFAGKTPNYSNGLSLDLSTMNGNINVNAV